MKLKIILSLAALVAAFSCTREKTAVEIQAPAPIVRLGEEVSPDAVLVKFGKALDDASINEIETSQGVALQRVFPSTPGREELEKRFGLDRWYEAASLEAVPIEELAGKVARIPRVKVVEYETIASKDSYGEPHPASLPETKAAGDLFNDPYLSYQWHYKNTGKATVSPNAVAGADINVYDVWSTLCAGDPDIIVAVVDEGVKYSHPDLAANMWTNTGEVAGNGIDDDGNGYIDDVHGYNFVTRGPVSWDREGDTSHGTHCAGTIAAVNNNGKGVCGVAGGTGKGDGCRIMSCQIFSGEAGGGSAVTARAIKYAADMGASVISCSYGYTSAFSSDNNYIRGAGSAEIDAIHYFEACRNNPVLDGNIAVFAAGNEAHNYAHYPGAFYDVISVSAFGPDFLPSYYTNYGPGCNIAAPGGEAYHIVNRWDSMVLSTFNSEFSRASGLDGAYGPGMDYAFYQGTSMACPHVSGVVALALSYAKKLGKTFTVDEFKRMILASTQDIDQRIASKMEKTYAYYQPALKLAPYYHQMGTGAIDAWRLMMHIEGLPTLTVQTGKSQWVDLSPSFGTSSVSLTYLSLDIPEATVNALGLQKITPGQTDKYPAVVDAGGYGYVQFGRLYINPTKIGSGKITIGAVGGGDHLGGGSNPPGGYQLSQTISVLARGADGGNGTGGWL